MIGCIYILIFSTLVIIEGVRYTSIFAPLLFNVLSHYHCHGYELVLACWLCFHIGLGIGSRDYRFLGFVFYDGKIIKAGIAAAQVLI